jgi:hypothetical protein
MAFHFVSEVDLDSPDSCVNGSRQERHTPETTTGDEAASFNDGMTDGPQVRLALLGICVFSEVWHTIRTQNRSGGFPTSE